jgi:poly-gamma-glutamate synthesis protein (capsule biosynthesis protein)
MTGPDHKEMTIVSARTITSDLPEDLAALLLISPVPTEGPTLKLCAVGDIGLSGRVSATGTLLGYDTILGEIAPFLRIADMSFGNLESPLTGEIAPNQLFSAPLIGANILRNSGFKLISLANNHVYDYGRAGLIATLEAVRKAGLMPLGVGDNPSAAQALVRTDLDGLRVGWLSCGRTLVAQSSMGPNYWEYNEQELLNAVECNRADVDLLIVSIHIGLMYMDYPRPNHKAMAERLMAAGANLILMHHAHVLQGVQTTSQRRLCCYNLGNLVFDWTEGNVKTPVMVREQNEGAVFHFVLDRNGVARASAIPIWIDDKCIVHWASGSRGIEILSRLARISMELKGDFVSHFIQQRADRNMAGILKVMWFHTLHGNWAFVLESMKKIRLEHVEMTLRWLAGSVKRLARGSIG